MHDAPVKLDRALNDNACIMLRRTANMGILFIRLQLARVNLLICCIAKK
jgi:hypothetical protein